ncbi:S41 family peptidase [Aquimarina spongiae]|nr:S41 family peptidase [Aquimarina spongiae]
MQGDLNIYKTILTKAHPGTFTHQTTEEFNAMINDMMLQTSKPMSAKAFYKILLKLIAKIHDGHTQAYTFGKLGSIINNQQRLPFQVYIKDERIYILKNLSQQKITEGSEILSIDNNLSNKIVFEILTYYSSDGESHNGMMHWLGGPYKSFNRIYPEIFNEKTTYDLVYRDYKTREITKTTIKSISKEVYSTRASKKYKSETSPQKAFMYRINTEENYAYMKISRFFKDSYEEEEDTYPIFYKQCFKEIHDKNIKNLIIDLRNNGGGKASNAAYLLQYFVDKPFTPAQEITTLGNDEYFSHLLGDTLDLDTSFGLKPKKDGTYRVTNHGLLRDLMTYSPIEDYSFNGKLIVLINGGTSSAAGIAAGLLQEYTDADLVGTETYGYAGISNGVRQISVKGKYTETAIYLPLLHAKYDVHEHIQKRSVVPDYHISHSIKDKIEKNDAIFEFALINLLKVTQKIPRQDTTIKTEH